MTGYRRLLRALASLAVAGLVVLGVLALLHDERIADVSRAGARLTITTDRRWAVWPFDCATISWRSSRLDALILNGEHIPPDGAQRLCGISARPPVFLATFPDGQLRTHSPAFVRVRVSPVALLVLLAIELLLVDAAASASPRTRTIARMAVFVVPLAVTLGLRSYRALASLDLLDWDETYYTSIAVTGAAGRGLYPAVVGFGPMPAMGGTGYAAYAYALGVKIFGPSVLVLRAISLLVSVAGLAGVWALSRKLYGTGTAWMAAALTSSLSLFVLSNSVRMDSWTFAYVTWALVVVAFAIDRWNSRWPHVLAGLVFGLGLQVHIDTTVTALACGLLYVVTSVARMASARRVSAGRGLQAPAQASLENARAARRSRVPPQPLLYLAGWLAALALYVSINILPDPPAYYLTTALIRVDATHWYSAGTTSVVASFLNPAILIPKAMALYSQLSGIVPALEIGLLAAAIVALLVRRMDADRVLRILLPGVLLVAAVLLNTGSPLYFIHVTPALIIPLAPLFTHGLRGQSKVSVSTVGPWALLAFAVVVSALAAVNSARSVWGVEPPAAESPSTRAFVERVRSTVERDCRVAGDGGQYVRHFTDYPNFVSWRATEMKYAMMFFGMTDEAAYWEVKRPDAVVSQQVLPPGLSSYVARHGLRQVEPGIWIDPRGCTAGR